MVARVPNIRNRYLFLSDLALLAAAPWLAYVIRFEGLGWRPADARTAAVYAGASLLAKLVVFLSFGMYGRLWRHASVPDLTKIIEATVVATSASALLGLIGLPASGLTLVRVPMSVAMLDAFLTITVVAAPRLLVRALANGQRRAGPAGKRVLIVGAGAAGEVILRELLANPQLALEPVGFVDDDPRKHNTRLNDVPVLGALSETRTLIERHRIEEILIAMPAAPGGVVRGVVRAAMEARIP